MQGLCPSRHKAVPMHEYPGPLLHSYLYLGDIAVPRDRAPMDFLAWFEVFLGGRWYTFDARHNHPVSAASSWRAAGDAAMLRSRQRLGWRSLRGFQCLPKRSVRARPPLPWCLCSRPGKPVGTIGLNAEGLAPQMSFAVKIAASSCDCIVPTIPHLEFFRILETLRAREREGCSRCNG